MMEFFFEVLLSSCSLQVQLCALFESGRELLSLGALCPKLLWQEYRRGQVCAHSLNDLKAKFFYCSIPFMCLLST